ncbi:hypothetical protein F4777DRAFT_546156 [Nemania sp. FL0916]|nr:hypothetical protein F4777DRAFT_546156 [Nemania sp. FL0916]
MEVISVIASFVAIGQAIGTVPKIINTLRVFTNASDEIEALINELEGLYGFYQLMKENIDLFSGEHNPFPLRVDEPPNLKLVRKDMEILVAELQGMADWCLTNNGNNLKVSKLRWWRKRNHVARLREECSKQQQCLRGLYDLFRDRFTYKQGQILVRIQSQVSQSQEQSPQKLDSLPSPSEKNTTPPLSPAEERAIVTKSDTASASPNATAEKPVGRRCDCFCHTGQISRQDVYYWRIRLPGGGYLSYKSQTVVGNVCQMNCCASVRSFTTLGVRIPIWLQNLALVGTLTFGFPLNIHLSLTSIIKLPSTWQSFCQLRRLCLLGLPQYLNQWLSYYGSSITAEDGEVLWRIMWFDGFSLPTYSITTWPGLIRGTDWGRNVARYANLTLLRGHSLYHGPSVKLSPSDRFHLANFVRSMEAEDDEVVLHQVAYIKYPIQKWDRLLIDTPDILTTRIGAGRTLLHWACVFNAVELVTRLAEFEGLLHAKDDYGQTPLHVAIRNRAWSSAELLLEKGCDTNVEDYYGHSPLTVAICNIYHGDVCGIRFAKILLSRKVSMETLSSSNAMDVWFFFRHHESHRDDVWELYEMIFRAGGAHLINGTAYWGYTPLMAAIIGRNVTLMRFLSKVGARLNMVNRHGLNLLHRIAMDGDQLSCQLAAEAEISCIDVRTRENKGFTHLHSLRMTRRRYFGRPGDFTKQPPFFPWDNYYEKERGEKLFSQSKLTAFENLLRGIRDRMLTQEIGELELIISRIRAQDLALAKEDLRKLTESKLKARIEHEAETFRAIGLDVRAGRLDLAIESIEEFIEVSRERMLVSPSDEEGITWELPTPGSGDLKNWKESDAEPIREIKFDEKDILLGVLQMNRTPCDAESREDDEDEDDGDGWKTAEGD